MCRTELLMAIVLAFEGIRGNLSEAQADAAIAIVESEFAGDLEAVKKHLAQEAALLALACRVVESREPVKPDVVYRRVDGRVVEVCS